MVTSSPPGHAPSPYLPPPLPVLYYSTLVIVMSSSALTTLFAPYAVDIGLLLTVSNAYTPDVGNVCLLSNFSSWTAVQHLAPSLAMLVSVAGEQARIDTLTPMPTNTGLAI